MRVVFLLFLIGVFGLGACKKCKDLQHVERTKLMAEYFGNYKPGAYWIYLNRDSTKRDSLWVDNYKTQKEIDKLQKCLEADEYFFDLHNKYLGLSEVWRVEIRSNYFNADIFEAFAQYHQSIIAFMSNNDSVSFYNSQNSYPETTNYPLWNNTPGIILLKVVKIKNLVFSPNIGLVQYIPDYSTDTFSLIKYYVP